MNSLILWNISFVDNKLHFFATEAGLHHIYSGTKKMICQMLKDLGVELEHEEVVDWSISSYLCNYLLEEGDTDWEDVWSPTWKVSIVFSSTLIDVPDFGTHELIRSTAYDDGIKSPSENKVFFPIKCLLVCDFQDKDDAVDCAEHLNSLLQSLSNHKNKSMILQELSEPELDHLYQEVFDTFINYKVYFLDKFLYRIQLNSSDEQQVLIELGPLEQSFYQQGASFAHSIIKIVETFEGTTTLGEYAVQ